MKTKIFVLAIALSLLLSGMLVAVGGKATESEEVLKESELVSASFGGGSGTEDDPYLIEDVYQLQNMSEYLDAHYELANDINATETRDWNWKDGFEPIGGEADPFEGSFDGNGYEIKELYINRPDTSDIGLFGWTQSEDTEIKDVGLVNVDISGNQFIGGLVGYNWDGTVKNSYATGNLSGGSNVGGLVGDNQDGTVSNSYATGDVSGDNRVGGLVGSGGTVKNSYATGDVSGGSNVGGLVGSGGTVKNSYATGDVSGGSNVGGLVGSSGTVKNSYATGDVSGGSNVGGLAGNSNYGTVSEAYATGNVSGDGQVGGLIGLNSNDNLVNNSYATGTVYGGELVGGLIGGNGYSYEGVEAGIIENSFANGNITGNSEVGGLVGENSGPVSNSYTNGNVTGEVNVGGLLGQNDEGWVYDSYATGTITRKTDSTNTSLGGFVGSNFQGRVIDCYSTGRVIYENTSNPTTKGFAGSVDEDGVYYKMSGNFWDNTTSQQDSTAGEATGKNTTEMKTESTFINEDWDFTNIWWMKENVTYPLFIWDHVISVEISPEPTATVDAGEELEFTAQALNENEYLVTEEVTVFTWENAEEDGLFRETETGIYDVTATLEGVTSNPTTVTVEPADIDYVEIDPDEDFSLIAGASENFTAEAYDEHHNLVDDEDSNFTWEYTDEYGLFDKTEVGKYDVTATYEDKISQTITVTVESAYSHIFSLMVDDIDAGQKPLIQIYDAEDEYGNSLEGNYEVEIIIDDETDIQTLTFDAGEANYTWEVIEDSDEYTAEVTIDGVSESDDFFVKTLDLDYVGIEPESTTVTAGESVTYTATAYDKYGNQIDDVTDETEWSIEDDAGGSWTDNLYESEFAGIWSVEGDYDGFTDSSTLTVEEADVEEVFISPSENQTIIEGEELIFSAEAYDVYGNLITDNPADFAWKNAEDGVFTQDTAFDYRTYEVTATYETITSTSTFVKVNPLIQITAPEGGVEELTFEENLTIEGETRPESQVWIEGEGIDVDGEGKFTYETTLVEGQNVFEVLAEDPDGNTYETNVYALYLPDIPELWEEINTIKSQMEEFWNEVDSLESDIENMTREIEELQEDIDGLQAQVEGWEERIGELESEIEELEERIEELEEENDTEEQTFKLEIQLNLLKEEAEDEEDQVEVLRAEIEELELEKDYLQSEVEEAEEEVDNLQTQLDEQEEDEEDEETPGFSSTLLLLAIVIAVAIYYKKDQ